MLKISVTFAALLLAAAPALAQVETIDPNQAADAYQSADQPADPYEAEDRYQPAPDAAAPRTERRQDSADDYTPIESAPPPAAPAAPSGSAAFDARNIPVTEETRVPAGNVLAAAEGVFGRGARGLANIIEGILRDQGEPVAYITGQEAGGAFVFGLRYGSGTMHHQVEGQRRVYWTGPSVGFDVGGNADKVFILVYNLHDSQRLFRRFPQAEGNVHFVGGFAAQYLRRGDVVLIPIRLGVGWRLGANAGYMRFSERSRWLPF
ncbi:DUF1134 domain-containing protein [Sphingosinicella sp.]|uniref:DUF1134 domain-containing protein n=1 Tax=Sphingosinicella sp. TaxID=1917971 RepID=UPI004037BC40